MTEQAKVPAIRFAGFTDPWEQRKLGELFFESNERSSSMEILSVSVAKGIYPASESDRDTNPGASLVNYKVVHKGDVVYNSMRMWQGAVGSSDYDGIVSPAYVVARPTIELDSTCFGYLLKRPEMLYKYLCDSQGNSKDTQTLKYDRFADIEATMPANLEEQRAISACLESVDHLITLHQRKYDKLVIFKKSMLEKMFPKDGESVPEIRFAGFTDPWEQRKFVDFVEASGIRNKDNLQLESYSVSNDRGFVPQDEQFENGGTMRDADKTAYWIVEPGSFAYNPARINVGSIGYQSTRKNVIVSSLYEVFKTDHSCDDRFLWHWFKSSLFTKQIEMLQEGGVRLYFFFDKLQKSEIWMPNVDEQRIIGQQFDQLDSLITLHQRKLELLQNIKKSLLDKMFV